MTAENIGIGFIFPEISVFLDSAYTTDLGKIQKYIDEAKSHETKRLRASDYLIIQELGFESEKTGVENLPAMLAAAVELEKDLAPEQKKLTPQKYLEFLRAGELKSAVNSAARNDIKDVELHTKNATILNGFLKDFE